MGYAAELRRAADEFVLVVAVVAEREGVDPKVLAMTELTNSVARLTESGALGRDPNEDSA